MSSTAWTSDDAAGTWTRIALPSAGYLVAAEPSYALVLPKPDRVGNRGLGKALLVTPGGQVTPRTPIPWKDTGFGHAVAADDAGVFLPLDLGSGVSWLMRTTDKGRTWQRLPPPSPSCWSFDPNLTVSGPYTLFSVCDGPNGGPEQQLTLVRSDDGARTWQTVLPLGNHPRTLVAAAPGHLWMYGNLADNIPGARLKVSTDSGRHWRAVTVPGLTGGGVQIATFAAQDATVWVTSRSDPAHVHVSTDNGVSWHVVPLAP